ncbi:MAG: hypothetical protein ACRDQY_22015 [Pseudonocardiaceae bacterium]
MGNLFLGAVLLGTNLSQVPGADVVISHVTGVDHVLVGEFQFTPQLTNTGTAPGAHLTLKQFDHAGYYYEDARALAHEAENTGLGALVLCEMSHLATWQGIPRTGIDHAVAVG